MTLSGIALSFPRVYLSSCFSAFSFTGFFLFVCLFWTLFIYFEREKDREREGERKRESQAGFALSAQCPILGLNSWTTRSWLELDVNPTEPHRCPFLPVFFLIEGLRASERWAQHWPGAVQRRERGSNMLATADLELWHPSWGRQGTMLPTKGFPEGGQSGSFYGLRASLFSGKDWMMVPPSKFLNLNAWTLGPYLEKGSLLI